MTTIEILRTILIFGTIILFVYLMMSRKISTLLALPIMGFLVAIYASFGINEWGQGFFGFFNGEVIGYYPDWWPPTLPDGWPEMISVPSMINGIPLDGLPGDPIYRPGTEGGLLHQVFAVGMGSMMSSIIITVVGGSFAVMIKKSGIAEGIVKNVAELSGKSPLIMGLAFYLITIMVFTVPLGMGGVILVGSIMLPILMTVGFSATASSCILLVGLSTGGLMNVGNWEYFSNILALETGDKESAYNMTLSMACIGFVVSFVFGVIFVWWQARKISVRNWGSSENGDTWWTKEDGSPNINPLAYLSPIIPVVLVLSFTIAGMSFPAEFAIFIGMIWLAIFAKMRKPAQLFTQSFVEGAASVSGAICIFIGLGIMLAGFKYPPVTDLMEVSMSPFMSIFASKVGMVLGFTLLTPLVMYRGPLNTWGIGAALMPVFTAAGFPPEAYLAAIYSLGIFQGYGDPTNDQNIWVASYTQVEPLSITKSTIWLGFASSFVVLSIAVTVFDFDFASVGAVKESLSISANNIVLPTIKNLGGIYV